MGLLEPLQVPSQPWKTCLGLYHTPSQGQSFFWFFHVVEELNMGFFVLSKILLIQQI